MGDKEFRAVLDWWICSDPFPKGVDKEVIDAWLDRESKQRGYDGIITALHKAP